MSKILKDGDLFPMRFLGFGFFWAWLFLAGVTPSPLIGTPTCFGEVPFEMAELSMRALWLAAALVAAPHLTTGVGQRALLAVGVTASALSAPLALALGVDPVATTMSAMAAAAGEVCMFLLWLCFFGYMKLGETFALLAGAYATGSALFLLTASLGFNAMAVASVMFPVFSGTAFVLSKRLGASRTGEGLFAAVSADAPDRESAAARRLRSENAADGAIPHGSFRARTDAWAQQARAGIALALYSFAFSLSCGIALFGEGTPGFFATEPFAMIALGLLCLAFFRFARHPERPYMLYRAVAPLIGLGFVLVALRILPVGIDGFCVALGYVLFELLALNDCCNLAKANDSSLLRVMAAARLAITIGMFAGWFVAFAAEQLIGTPTVVAGLAALGLFTALIAVSLVFTEHDLVSYVAVADDRALVENVAKGASLEEAAAVFAETRGLSRREEEVAAYLLAGRTTVFAAEKLFIAESTVRAHVHSIYRKCDVHSRMELMDAFDEFRANGSF